MLTRERRSLVPSPTLPDFGRTGRKGASRPGLPSPAALPSLPTALSRRAALFGAVTVAGASATACTPAKGHAAALSTNDARLVAIAAELTELDRFVSAYPAIGKEDEEADHPAYYGAIDAVPQLEDEIAETPADTMAGVLAKVRAHAIPVCGGMDNGLTDSVCADLLRLHIAGMVS